MELHHILCCCYYHVTHEFLLVARVKIVFCSQHCFYFIVAPLFVWGCIRSQLVLAVGTWSTRCCSGTFPPLTTTNFFKVSLFSCNCTLQSGCFALLLVLYNLRNVLSILFLKVFQNIFCGCFCKVFCFCFTTLLYNLKMFLSIVFVKIF